ncbi:MAG: glycoside hydrolase [Pirellula sp.]|nr:glycoside hydrolase [Pirellula sp.]
MPSVSRTILSLMLLWIGTLDVLATEFPQQDNMPKASTIVFEAGMSEFASIRIPSIILSKSKVLLAFAEGRAADRDQAFNKIILRRSFDLGATWSTVQIIAADKNAALNNPCAVLEAESGTIFLTYQSYPGTLSERSGQIGTGYDGDNIVRCWLIRSTDEGASWTEPVEITRSAKRENIVTTIASGPGIGIQITAGPHAGRLVFPFNEGPFGLWNIYTVYSDDRGQTWKMGEVAPGALVESNGKRTSQVNECQVVEMNDGRLMMNARRWAGNQVRKATTSDDGGATWAGVVDVPEIKDPSCMGSIIRCKNPNSDEAPLLLFSGPNSDKRTNGTIFISEDQGQTWPKSKVIDPGLFAYSCLVELPDSSIGCLYEAEDMSSIRWKKWSIRDLLE